MDTTMTQLQQVKHAVKAGTAVREACQNAGMPVWKYYQLRAKNKSVLMDAPKPRKRKSIAPTLTLIPARAQRMIALIGAPTEILQFVRQYE